MDIWRWDSNTFKLTAFAPFVFGPSQNDVGYPISADPYYEEDMNDSNGHTLSQKQQEKYLKADTDLSSMYSLEAADDPEAFTETPTTSQKTTFLPCTVAAILPKEDQIYLPLSQAQALFSKTGTQRNVTKILLKIKGKENLEKAKELFELPSVD